MPLFRALTLMSCQVPVQDNVETEAATVPLVLFGLACWVWLRTTVHLRQGWDGACLRAPNFEFNIFFLPLPPFTVAPGDLNQHWGLTVFGIHRTLSRH